MLKQFWCKRMLTYKIQNNLIEEDRVTWLWFKMISIWNLESEFDDGVKLYFYFWKYFQRFSSSGVGNAGRWLPIASIQTMCHLTQRKAGAIVTVLNFWQQLTGSQGWNRTWVSNKGKMSVNVLSCNKNVWMGGQLEKQGRLCE